jgi:hypothetical protein
LEHGALPSGIFPRPVPLNQIIDDISGLRQLAVTGFAMEAYAAPFHLDDHDHGTTAGIRFQKPDAESKYARQFTYPYLSCGNKIGIIIMQHDGTIQTWNGKTMLHGSSVETRESISSTEPKSTGMMAVLKEFSLTTSDRHRERTEAIVDIEKLLSYHS